MAGAFGKDTAFDIWDDIEWQRNQNGHIILCRGYDAFSKTIDFPNFSVVRLNLLKQASILFISFSWRSIEGLNLLQKTILRHSEPI